MYFWCKGDENRLKLKEDVFITTTKVVILMKHHISNIWFGLGNNFTCHVYFSTSIPFWKKPNTCAFSTTTVLVSVKVPGLNLLFSFFFPVLLKYSLVLPMLVPPSNKTASVIYLILDVELIKTELSPFIHRWWGSKLILLCQMTFYSTFYLGVKNVNSQVSYHKVLRGLLKLWIC